MKVAYIKRSFSHEPLKKRVYYKLARSIYYRGQDGYFEAAIDFAFNNIKKVRARKVLNDPEKINNRFDIVLVNHKCCKGPLFNQNKIMQKIARVIHKPLILFVGTDKASQLPPNKTLDHFDLVYKREPYEDFSKYNLSNQNEQKIYPTILANPIDRIFRINALKQFFNVKTPNPSPCNNYNQDIFFAGALTTENKIRSEVWRWVQGMDHIDSYGGVQKDRLHDVEAPEDVRFEFLDRQDYLQEIRKSKINLALDGIGEFTFRHLELWYLGAFMISSPTIRELDLPLDAEEGKHYVCYDDRQDLEDKIHYYLNHPEERERVAQAGKEMYEESYNYKKHGKSIKDEIKKIYEGK